MHSTLVERQRKREKRVMRVRKHVRGTAEKPRMSVFKSNLHISAQIIDDESGKTIVSLGTLSNEFKGTEYAKKSKAAARLIGEKLAKMALENKVERVVFDRGRYKYHGIIAELAEGARSAGLQF